MSQVPHLLQEKFFHLSGAMKFTEDGMKFARIIFQQTVSVYTKTSQTEEIIASTLMLKVEHG